MEQVTTVLRSRVPLGTLAAGLVLHQQILTVLPERKAARRVSARMNTVRVAANYRRVQSGPHRDANEKPWRFRGEICDNNE